MLVDMSLLQQDYISNTQVRLKGLNAWVGEIQLIWLLDLLLYNMLLRQTPFKVWLTSLTYLTPALPLEGYPTWPHLTSPTLFALPLTPFSLFRKGLPRGGYLYWTGLPREAIYNEQASPGEAIYIWQAFPGEASATPIKNESCDLCIGVNLGHSRWSRWGINL